MKYALNLAEDGRILSATFEEYADANGVVVDTLPEGNLSDYKYINKEYIYNPLPAVIKPIPKPTLEERLIAVEKQNEELVLALADVYGGGTI